MQYSYDAIFDAPGAHFDNFCLFSDAQAEILGNPKCYNCKTPPSTECCEMEPKLLKDRAMHEGGNPNKSEVCYAVY
jgi:hypothetical protein